MDCREEITKAIKEHERKYHQLQDERPKAKKKRKRRYLDFVLLTDEEHQKLVDRFGEAGTEDWINRLNDYIASRGRRYKSHYHTILNWARMNGTFKTSEEQLAELKQKGLL